MQTVFLTDHEFINEGNLMISFVMDISKNCPMTGISYHATKDLRF